MPRRSSAPDGTTNVKNPAVAGRSASDRWLLDNPRERQPEELPSVGLRPA